jgi:galactitol-specific phosphotransferase system IIB component
MRSRRALTAALALSVVTILAVAACGSSVQGSAQVNTAAAETATSAETTADRTTERTSRATEPTDLSDLSSMLNDLTTELSVPTDLSLPSDLTFPTELSDLTDIPGYNSDCLTVSFAYLGIGLAAFGTLGGQGTYDAAELKKSLDELTASVPAEIAADVQALNEVAAEANGKSLAEAGQLFESEKFTTASDNISKWLDANCGGN